MVQCYCDSSWYLSFPSAGAFDVVLEAFLLSSSRWCYGISFCFLTPRLTPVIFGSSHFPSFPVSAKGVALLSLLVSPGLLLLCPGSEAIIVTRCPRMAGSSLMSGIPWVIVLPTQGERKGRMGARVRLAPLPCLMLESLWTLLLRVKG